MRLKEKDWNVTGHVWRKQEALVKIVLQEDPKGKISPRPQLR